MREKAVIIGAGIAGLSVGCYLQKNGFNTLIVEAHDKPGGLCTSWRRNGYLIEGCIHGLLGSSPSHPLYELWNELIDFQNIGFVHPDIKTVMIFPDGETFYQYADLERLSAYLLEISPEDKQPITEFINGARYVQRFRMPLKARALFGLSDYLAMLRYLPSLSFIKKWNSTSAEEFSARFKYPLLRRVFMHAISPVLFEMFVCAEMDLKRAGYPRCGSLQFSRLLEEKYISLGGTVVYKSKVKRILVNNRTAQGVLMTSDITHEADIVISAADARATIYDLLGVNYISTKVERVFSQTRVNTSRIQVSLGVNRIISTPSISTTLIPAEPVLLSDGSIHKSIAVLIFDEKYSSHTPPGKTLLTVQMETPNYSYWKDLREYNYSEYRLAKKRTAEAVISILEQHWNGISEEIEMVDVATPATYIRYTDNWKGSTQGWSNDKLFGGKILKNRLPGLNNFYMVGQWVEPGAGVPNVFLSGRNTAQVITLDFGKQPTPDR